jgi:hypothetical protein
MQEKNRGLFNFLLSVCQWVVNPSPTGKRSAILCFCGTHIGTHGFLICARSAPVVLSVSFRNPVTLAVTQLLPPFHTH